MRSRLLLIALEAVAAALLAVVLLATFVMWRLASGPIDLDFARSYFDRALNPPDQAFAIEVDGWQFEWNGWSRALDLTARRVLVRDRRGDPLADMPAVLVRLSARGLLRGEITPLRVTVSQPRLRLVREAGEAWRVAEMGAGQSVRLPGTLAQVLDGLSDEAAASPYRMLTQFEIVDGTVEVVDSAGPYSGELRGLGLKLSRNGRVVSFDVAASGRLDGSTVPAGVHGQYDPDSGRLSGTADLLRLPGSAVARRAPELARSFALDGMIDARFGFSADDTTGLTLLDVSLKSANGRLTLPALYAEPLAYDQLSLNAGYDAAAGAIKVSQLRLDTGPIAATVTATAALGEPVIRLTADAVVTGMPVSELERYWPRRIGTDAWNWVTRNLENGSVSKATSHLEGEIDGTDLASFRLISLGGDMEFSGVTVHYFRPLPPGVQAAGRAVYDHRSIVVTLDSGRIGAVRLQSAVIDMYDLDTDIELATMDVTVRGPVREMLDLLDRKPLGYAQALGLSPSQVTGRAEARATFAFPFAKRLTMDRVNVSAKARLSDVSVQRIVADQMLDKADLSLELEHTRTARSLAISGRGNLAGVPLDLSVEQALAVGAPRRIGLAGEVGTDAIARLGLPLAPYLDGAMRITDATIVEAADGSRTAKVVIDLQQASMALPQLDWSKPVGWAGTMRLSAARSAAGRIDVELDSLVAKGLSAHGAVALAAGGAGVTAVRIDEVQVGETRFTGTAVRAADGGFDATVTGTTLDLRPILERDDAEDEPGAGVPVRLAFAFDQLLAGKLAPIRSVSGTLAHDGSRIRSFDVSGTAGHERVAMTYGSEGEARGFEIESDDAGAVLQGLDILDTINGGKLMVKGRIEGHGAQKRTRMTLAVEEFHMVKAPLLAQILNAALLPVLLDVLQGNGIGFSRLDAEIDQTGGITTVTQALATGPSLGVSVSGTISTEGDRAIDMSGTVVPLYAVNRVIGSIPLVGPLITGGKGGGVIGADYRLSGTLDKPVTTVNPLSALTPGILKPFLRALGSVVPGGRPSDGAPAEEQPARPAGR